MSLPYRLYTITSIDLKALGISEEKRTLSYRKNIMVKFSKNGRHYLKMGICCASPGLPTGHVRGRLKDRDQTENPRPVATYQYLTDHNKNVTGLTDTQGNLVATWDYDAFGNTIQQTGSLANSNPLRFSSEYHDEDLGLVYYNYRHYNPCDGRWISRDNEEDDGYNLYNFLRNDGINFIDILGEKSFPYKNARAAKAVQKQLKKNPKNKPSSNENSKPSESPSSAPTEYLPPKDPNNKSPIGRSKLEDILDATDGGGCYNRQFRAAARQCESQRSKIKCPKCCTILTYCKPDLWNKEYYTQTSVGILSSVSCSDLQGSKSAFPGHPTQIEYIDV